MGLLFAILNLQMAFGLASQEANYGELAKINLASFLFYVFK